MCLVSTNLLQVGVDIHCVLFDQEVYILAEISCKMTQQQVGNKVPSLLTIILVCFVFATLFLLVMRGFEHNRRRGWLFIKKGRMVRT
jgi:hypothetical protein